MANGAKNNGKQNSETRGLDERVAGMANDAGQYIFQISTRIAEDAEKKARQALSDYEKEIEKIVLQSKEELGKKSLEISEKIREAILLKAEETSNGLIERIVADKNKTAEEMAQKLQTAKVEAETVTPEEAKIEAEAEVAKPEEVMAEKEQPADAKDEAAAEDKGELEEKHRDAEYKSARAAAEFGYKIENLGVQANPEGKNGEGQKADTGEHTTEVVKSGDEADIDDFVRYLSQ
ncbi:MAG: hypothetical protein ABUK03_04350 [Dehalococcoidales bacterium]